MIIVIFLLLLIFSFTLHIYFLIQYVMKKEPKHLKWFVNTAISNIIIAGVLTVLVIFKPEHLRALNLRLVLWGISGFLMLVMLLVKINILRNIMKRAKDPANYHFNFFGKKVIHSSVVLQGELITFFITIPFFLFSGAYFIARLVNLLLLGRL